MPTKTKSIPVKSIVPLKGVHLPMKKAIAKGPPRHRTFVGFMFVMVVLIVLSFSVFAFGYAAGRYETVTAATSVLSDVAVRWQKLQERGVVPQGPTTTQRITGTVGAMTSGALTLDADPVSFEIFSDEPRIRTVLFSSATSFVDIAADGSVIIPRQPLKVGERVAVVADRDVRSAGEFSVVRIERYR